MRSVAPLLLLCCLPGCVTTEPAPVLEIGCSDVAVVGWIETLGETPVPSPPPLANWNSAFQLRVHIRQVVHGSERRRVVPATVTAHSQIRDDRDFLIVLTPDGKGGYALETAALWQDRPKLGKPCV